MSSTIEEALARSVAALRSGDPAHAEELLRAAAASAPLDHRPLTNLAAVLRTLGRPDEAEAALRSALAIRPEAPLPWETLGNLLDHHGRTREAVEAYGRVLALAPDRAEARWGLARSLLRLGDGAGWAHYEIRVDLPELRITRPPGRPWTPDAPEPVCLWPEQGFGDQIMAARFAAGSAAIYAPTPLLRLFVAMGLEARGLTPAALPPNPAMALCLSMPGLLGMSPTAPPPPLTPRVSARSLGRVGVMTSGNPSHRNDANRSLPREAAARLLALPGAVDLTPAQTGASDFLETAEIIAGCDVVLTVDTAVAHLAGTLGKPTFVLLPAVGVDWRWLDGREDTPWYPSGRLIRRAEDEPWHSVVDRALAAAGL